MSEEPAPPIELRPSALIRASSDGTWEPDEAGFDALLMPVTALGGDIIDTVAWEFGRPAVWWLRRGIATFVGEHEIFLANQRERQVKLVATPKEYLAHWGHAVCILNWTADVKAILGQINRGIICESAPLAARATRAVNLRPSDRIKITVAA